MIDLNKYTKLFKEIQQIINKFVYQVLITYPIDCISKNMTYLTHFERLNSYALKNSFLLNI